LLGIVGTVAFIFGSRVLIDPGNQSYQIALSAILAMAVANIGIIMGVLIMVYKSHQKPLENSTEKMLGVQGRTVGMVANEGQASLNGEIWSVYATKRIPSDTEVKVIGFKGLQLEVEEVQKEQ
jgi:membrane-bound ClpP family serine protease